MKVLIIVDETPFYQPNFTDLLIRELKAKNFDIYGANVIKIDKKNNIEKYLISKFYRLFLSEILILSFKKILFTLFSFIFPDGFKRNFFSVKSVFKKNETPFFSIKKNINENKYIERIMNLNLDLIINSSSLIFGKEILNVPKYTCLNRHTSLLPSFAGLWPVLQAISNNEQETGVTIHQMTSKIDSGKIYSQKKIDISNNKNVSQIYKIAFKISSGLVVDAIENLTNGKEPSIESIVKRKSSYYSFPTKVDWSNFRKNGGKFA